MGRRNKRDKYGIYEIPNYQKKRVIKKKKKFTFSNVLRLLFIIAVLLVVGYIVSIGIKVSMRGKAISLYEEEDYKGAIDLFEEALNPTLPLLEFLDNDIRFYLADCYVNEGDYGSACVEYSKIYVWNNYENVDGLEDLQKIAYGLQLYDWKEYREALPILLEAYESGYGELVLYVGSCYGQTGDTENMQLYYDVFLRKHEMNGFMYAQYAAIALDEDKLDEAYSYIQEGLQLKEDSGLKELKYDEIVYYEKLNDYNTAFEKASAFIKDYPNDADGKNEYELLYTRRTDK